MEKESLALVCATMIFRPYLIGNDLRVFTDQSSQSWLLGAKDPSGKIAIWKLFLSEFTGMEILYKPGQWNSTSDMFSRIYTESRDAQARYLEPAVFSLNNRGGIFREGEEGVALHYFSTCDSDGREEDLIFDESCIARDKLLCTTTDLLNLEDEVEQLSSVMPHEEIVIEQGKNEFFK